MSYLFLVLNTIELQKSWPWKIQVGQKEVEFYAVHICQNVDVRHSKAVIPATERVQAGVGVGGRDR